MVKEREEIEGGKGGRGESEGGGGDGGEREREGQKKERGLFLKSGT